MTASAFRTALGDDFSRLHPRIQKLLGSEGTVNAHGVFASAGARARWLAPVLAITTRWGLLFPEHERNVPFTVTLTITAQQISTLRRFQFASRTRVLADETRLIAGQLVDMHARRLLVRMRSTVAEDGTLHFESASSRLRLGQTLLWFPRVPVSVTQWWDAEAEAHGIRVTVRVPLLGEVFGYEGTFTTDESA